MAIRTEKFADKFLIDLQPTAKTIDEGKVYEFFSCSSISKRYEFDTLKDAFDLLDIAYTKYISKNFYLELFSTFAENNPWNYQELNERFTVTSPSYTVDTSILETFFILGDNKNATVSSSMEFFGISPSPSYFEITKSTLTEAFAVESYAITIEISLLTEPFTISSDMLYKVDTILDMFTLEAHVHSMDSFLLGDSFTLYSVEVQRGIEELLEQWEIIEESKYLTNSLLLESFNVTRFPLSYDAVANETEEIFSVACSRHALQSHTTTFDFDISVDYNVGEVSSLIEYFDIA